MSKKSQDGFSQIFLFLILAAGLIIGLYLVQHPQIFKSKANEGFINLTNQEDMLSIQEPSNYGEPCSGAVTSSIEGESTFKVCQKWLTCRDGVCRKPINTRGGARMGDSCGINEECGSKFYTPALECIGRDSSYDLSSDSLDGESQDENGETFTYEKLGSAQQGLGKCTYYKGLKENQQCSFSFECSDGLICGQNLYGDSLNCSLFGDFKCKKPENQMSEEKIIQIMEGFRANCPAKI